MFTQLRKVALKARSDPKIRFTSLAHILSPEFLRETWAKMNRQATYGVDGETIQKFEKDLESRLESIHERLRKGTYQAPPVRRVEIPKGEGKLRPLGIPTLAAYCTSFNKR